MLRIERDEWERKENDEEEEGGEMLIFSMHLMWMTHVQLVGQVGGDVYNEQGHISVFHQQFGH